jgi:hypothetical protein
MLDSNDVNFAGAIRVGVPRVQSSTMKTAKTIKMEQYKGGG